MRGPVRCPSVQSASSSWLVLEGGLEAEVRVCPPHSWTPMPARSSAGAPARQPKQGLSWKHWSRRPMTEGRQRQWGWFITDPGARLKAQNALVETINGPLKAEVIHRRGPSQLRARRIADAGLGRLVQQPSPPRAHREHLASRGGGKLLSGVGNRRHRRVTAPIQPPASPGGGHGDRAGQISGARQHRDAWRSS